MDEVEFKHVVFFNSESANRFSTFRHQAQGSDATGRSLVSNALNRKKVVKELFRELPGEQGVFIYNTTNSQPSGERGNYVVPVPGMEALGVQDLSSNQIGFLQERGAKVVPNKKVRSLSRVDRLGLYHARPDMDRAWQIDDVLRGLSTEALGKGVRIGIVDTGINLSHPEFSGMDVPAVRVRGHRTEAISRAGGDPLDHGTSVASLIAGRRLGISRSASIAVCDVFEDEDGARPLDILRGIEWLKSSAFGGRGVDVINMSLGIVGYSDIFREAIVDALQFDGVLFVAAIGNDGHRSGPGCSPACYNEVLSVGAYDRTASAAVFSNCGRARPSDPEQPDIWAPGVEVYAATADGKYDAIDGTSFASPLVAAIAAKIIAANPVLRRKPARVVEAILATAESSLLLPSKGHMLRAGR